MSSDPIDQACDYEQHDREVCIAVARQQANEPELKPMGICYNCGDPVGLGERFCHGHECRDDYTKRKQAELRRGRTQ